jgi:hypothetical protein
VDGRQPFRYAPERPTTGKVRVARFPGTSYQWGQLSALSGVIISVCFPSIAAHRQHRSSKYMKPNRREFTLMGAGSVVATLSTPSVLSALSIDPTAAPSTGAVETSWNRHKDSLYVARLECRLGLLDPH